MSDGIAYKFTSSALTSEDTFSVIDFRGIEGLSRNYEFTINLKSLNAEIDPDAVLNKKCTFKRLIGETESVVTGILSNFEQLHQVEDYVLYRATLVPSLWKLSLFHTNEVYLDMSVPEIIESVLKETGFHPSIDYELKLNSNYEKWAYRCQYGENHLAFIKRLMEHEGIYYYFEHSEDTEKIIFCDNLQNHAKADDADLNYSPVSGLDITEGFSNLHSFVCKHKRMPKKVILKDYNYEKPSLDVEGEAVVDENGTGEVFLYGENFNTPEEGSRYAKLRSEEILCTKEVFIGEGIVNQIKAGYLFNLKGHFRNPFNRDYLVTEIEHEGAAPSYLTDSGGMKDIQAYMNSFTAVTSDTQFRPERKTEKPKFYGTINAIIDAGGEGKYAEVDDQGRYKVVLPFDRVKRGESGKASCWIRMAQPYSGTTEGMHFPLRKGTEVLLTFINGDPDQPVISGAVPNAAQPSVVTGENQTNNLIRTAAGNLIEMEDKENSNRIKLSTPKNSTYFHLGAPNASGSGIVSLTDGIERKVIGGGQQITVFSSTTDADQMTDRSGTADSSTDYETPGENARKLMYSAESTSANKPTGANGHQFIKKEDDGTNSTDAQGNDIYLDPESSASGGELSGEFVVERRDAPRYVWTEGNQYVYGGAKDYNFGNSYTEDHACVDQIEANSETFSVPSTISGANNYSPDDNFVEKVWGDKHEYQCGNNYTWGDTCDYEFGNGYAESHVDFDDSNDSINQKFEVSFPKSDVSTIGRGAAAGVVGGAVGGVVTGVIIGVVSGMAGTAAAGGVLGAVVAGLVGAVVGVLAGVIGGAIGENYTYSGNVGDVVEPPPHEEDSDKTIKTKFGKVELNTDTTSVEKTIGDTYEFSKGNAIEIFCGNKEEHNQGDRYEYTYGGIHEEANYSGDGILLEWSKKGKGKSEESTFDPVTGYPLSYSFSYYGAFTFNVMTPTTPKLEITADFSITSMAMNFSVNETVWNGKLNSVELNTNLCDMSFCFQPFKVEVANSDVEIKLPGVDIDTKATELNNKLNQIVNKTNHIRQGLLQINRKTCKLASEDLKAENSLLTLFS